MLIHKERGLTGNHCQHTYRNNHVWMNYPGNAAGISQPGRFHAFDFQQQTKQKEHHRRKKQVHGIEMKTAGLMRNKRFSSHTCKTDQQQNDAGPCFDSAFLDLHLHAHIQKQRCHEEPVSGIAEPLEHAGVQVLQ